MGDESEKASMIEAARLYLGVPRPNADVLVALSNAWHMGYRSPASLAHMAGKMLRVRGAVPAATERNDG